MKLLLSIPYRTGNRAQIEDGRKKNDYICIWAALPTEKGREVERLVGVTRNAYSVHAE